MHSLRPHLIVSALVVFTFGAWLAAPDAAAQGYTIPSAHPRILLNEHGARQADDRTVPGSSRRRTLPQHGGRPAGGRRLLRLRRLVRGSDVPAHGERRLRAVCGRLTWSPG